ncbi:hypothetical protein C1N81_01310 (plasmid) [Streptomyces sp. SGAir0957]
MLRAAVTSRGTTGDPDGMSRLLTSATSAFTAAAECGRTAGTGTTTHAPSAVEAADLDRVCGIDGFRLPRARGPNGQPVTAQVSGSLTQDLRPLDASERAATHVPAAQEFAATFGGAARTALRCG